MALPSCRMLFAVSSCLRLEKKARLSGYLLTTLHPLWKSVVFLSSSWCLVNGYFKRPSLEKHAKRLKTFTQLKEDKKLNIQAIPILKTTKHSNYKLFPTALLLLNYQIKILNQTSPVGHNWQQGCRCPSCNKRKYINDQIFTTSDKMN